MIYAELKDIYRDRLFLVRGRYDQSGLKYIIGQCDMFIGSRMHACIAALSQHIPAVGIAYSRKFSGVFETVGAAAYVADPRKLENKDILLLIDRVYKERVSVQRQLAGTIPGVKTAIMRLFPDIFNAVRPIVPLRHQHEIAPVRRKTDT